MSYLAIDIGGSSIKYALMNDREILDRGDKIKTPREDLDAFLNILFGIYDRYESKIEGVAISAPGRIDSSTGYFYHGGALRYLYHVNLIELLSSHMHHPITVENDGKCAALAELWRGSMMNVENGIVIAIGTGVGGGVIINHQLYRGSHSSAGEIGNMIAFMKEPFSPDHTWVNLSRSHSLLDMYTDRMGLARDEIGGKWFFQRANRKDPDALAVLREYCTYLTNGILSIQAVLDIERIAIGGGYSKETLFLEYLNQSLEGSYAKIDPHYAVEKPEVVLCTFGNDSNLIGALYYHLQQVSH